MFSRIMGTGSYLPEKCLTNADLEKLVDTSDEWIVSRSGIQSRHIAADDQSSSDLAYEASHRALAAAGITPDQLGMIIVATTTPDMLFPSTACLLQAKLGAHGCPAFDVQAVCSGFVYALTIADQFIKSGAASYVLVVGAETLSRIVDWTDRTTCVLFGDGAGAVVLGASEETGILGSVLRADGAYLPLLKAPGAVRRGEVTGNPFIEMDGPGVFKFAIKSLGEVATAVLAKCEIEQDQLDWLIPHQANLRIIEGTAKKLGLPLERVVITVQKHGNTSAASIPLAMDHAARSGQLQRGQTVLLEGIGGGFTWGAVLLRW